MSLIQPVFTWVIAGMNVRPNADGLSNVVCTVHWRYCAEFQDVDATPANGETPIYTAEIYGSYNPPAPSAEFVPYEQLTKETVVGWLESGLEIDSLQDRLRIMIRNNIVPPVLEPPLPWRS